MLKKTILSIAIATTGLTGCFSDGGNGGNGSPDYDITDTTVDRSIVRPIFDPNPISPTLDIPAHFDLVLLLGAGQSPYYDFTGLSPNPENPAEVAVNSLPGFSGTSAFNVRFDGELDPATVIKGATVFLYPLSVDPAVDSAPLALPSINPADITGIDTATAAETRYQVDVVSVDGGTNNAIRISPLEPLKANTKFLVLVSDGVKGANGKPIDKSLATRYLTEGALATDSLTTVRDLLNGLFGLGDTILASGPSKTALAYTFTTNDYQKVLTNLASPATNFQELGQKIGFNALLKAVRDNNPGKTFSQLTEILGKIQAGDSAFIAENQATAAAVQAAAATATPTNISNAIGAVFADGGFPFPTTRPSFFYSKDNDASSLATIAALPDGNGIKSAASVVSYSEGTIVLPYYQPIPGSDGSKLVSGGWKADKSLETKLNTELGGDVFTFLRDVSPDVLNLNEHYPYPALQGNVAVPVVVFYPKSIAPACGSGIEGVTIFQHGITVDRSVSMLPGILLAAQNCQAVVAIDQPLHGLAGATLGTIAGLDVLEPTDIPDPVQTAFSAVPGGLTYIGERHFGFTDGGSLTPVAKTDPTEIKSGSLFVNLKSFDGTRDNLAQGVMDLLNLASSLDGSTSPSGVAGLDFTGDTDPDLTSALPVNLVGHSLGGITGSVFAELSNDPVVGGSYGAPLGGLPKQFPSLNSVSLMNSGGQLTRIIENSPSLSGSALAALPAQGTSPFESFLYVYQSVIDTVDPVNYAVSLGHNQTNVLMTEVTGDTTVPNEAYTNPLGNAFPAPLAGTEPLMALVDIGAGGAPLADSAAGVTVVDADTAPGLVPAPVGVIFAGTNPCSDANHGTFVAPVAPNANCPGGAADTSLSFGEMVGLTVGVTLGGVQADPDLLARLGTSATIDDVLGQ